MIIPATYQALLEVFLNLREPDLREVRYTRGLEDFDPADMAQQVVDTPGVSCVCVNRAGVPVAAAGLVNLEPAEPWVAWALGTDAMPRHRIEIHRAVRGAVERALVRGQALQAFSWVHHPDGSYWLKRLGFQCVRDVLMPGSDELFHLYQRRA